jgi:hypothetical protein
MTAPANPPTGDPTGDPAAANWPSGLQQQLMQSLTLQPQGGCDPDQLETALQQLARWRLACGFYLGSLVGTAATDGAIAATGLMPLWPLAVGAEPAAAAGLLSHAASTLLHPAPLLVIAAFGLGLAQLSRWLWNQGPVARVAATAVATTLVVDALFLGLALLAPRLSGLI